MNVFASVSGFVSALLEQHYISLMEYLMFIVYILYFVYVQPRYTIDPLLRYTVVLLIVIVVLRRTISSRTTYNIVS